MRKPFCMIWETFDCCDGVECDTFEDAKAEAIECLMNWQVEERNNHPLDINEWTDKDIDDWDYFIANMSARVSELNENGDYENDIDDEWFPSYEDEKEIGWLPYEKLKVLENSVLKRK